MNEREDCNSGPGWYEVINPRGATTCIAYVHENGDLYLPEDVDSMSQVEFEFAAARSNAHRLVRADGTGVDQTPAVLTGPERQFLTFALDLAFDRMVSDDGFTDKDEAALKRLRLMAITPDEQDPHA